MNLENLIEENKKLIYSLASRYSNYYSIEDLFQVGVIGLIKAYKNYKPNQNAKFTTYAHPYIFGEIIEYIKNDRTMKVSKDILKIYKSYEKAKDFLTNHYNKEPSINEISKFMGVSIQELEYAIEKSKFVISLDAPLNEENFTLDNTLSIDKRNEIDALLDLKKEIENLTKEERKLIELRYFKDYTQSETAEYLGINQVQVSRYETQILKKIKTKITA